MKRADLERLKDILEAISKIEKYYIREHFERDELMQAGLVHFLEIIGEACRSLTQQFKDKHNQVKWSDPISFRNVLVHQYFEIDFFLVQKVIENELPILKIQIESILTEF
jgi:uncharacterized protein with HEPN domain